MNRRSLLLSAAFLAGVVALVLGVLAMIPTQNVIKQRFDQIEDGMTRAEVEGILGRHDADLDMPDAEVAGRALLVWSHADGSHMSIRFADDKVTHTQFHPSTETFTDKVRRWLGIGNERRAKMIRQL